jgi:hypothetical protein
MLLFRKWSVIRRFVTTIDDITVGSEFGFTLEHSMILCLTHISSTLALLWLEVFKIPALSNSPALWGSHVKSGLLPEDLGNTGQYWRCTDFMGKLL